MRRASGGHGDKQSSGAAAAPTATMDDGRGRPQSDAAVFLQSLQDPEIIERVRCTIKNAHVFKLPPRTSAGWRGADWTEKVWQGTVKVVERGDLTAVLLVDRSKGSIFAVCPIKEGAVDRCVDSSRYFVLRIENANGRHMFIGLAFNERNDAFDFNTSLEDSKREKEMERNPASAFTGPARDYSIKEGEKIHVSIPKQGQAVKKGQGGRDGGKGAGLKPSSRDTPARGPASPLAAPARDSAPSPLASKNLDLFFTNSDESDPFPSTSFSGSNFFQTASDDQSTFSSMPFFKPSEGKDQQQTFDPRSYQTKL